jgi:pyruvate formate lyase activating enzyme
MKGIIFDIKKFAVHDGPGIRLTIFFKGCPMKCWWCHNPEGISNYPEVIEVEKPLDGKVFIEKETIGRWITVEELMKEIEQDIIFYDESGGGVTFSGGEPLIQFGFLLDLLQQCRDRNIHTVLDTTGYCNEKKIRRLLGRVDLYLYDIKIIDDLLHKKYTGVSNKSILNNLRTLCEANEKVILSFPVIPSITDTSKNIGDLKTFLGSFIHNIREIRMLPYHNTATNKYKRLNIINRMEKIKSTGKKKLTDLKDEFEKEGYKVKIGG